MSDYTNRLWTLQDAVDSILDQFDLELAGRDLRQAISAMVKAYRDWPGLHDWQWYITDHWFKTSPIYSTGTVAYDSATATVTLTGGTFPSDSALSKIVLSERIYEIQERVDDTHIKLQSRQILPDGDIAAGASYQVFRTHYEIPTEARMNFDLLDYEVSAAPWAVQYVPEGSVLFLHRSIYYSFTSPSLTLAIPYTDEPRAFTIGRWSKSESGYAVVFAEVPKTARPYRLVYWRNPRRLITYKVQVPSVSVTQGSATLTAAASVFNSSHVGSMVRVSGNQNYPTPVFGGIGTTNPVNPMAFQSTIKSVTSGTEVELDDAAPETLSTVAAVVSDPLDVDHDIMLTGLLARATHEFALYQRRDEGMAVWYAEMRRKLTEAKEFDEDFRRSRGIGVFGSY